MVAKRFRLKISQEEQNVETHAKNMLFWKNLEHKSKINCFNQAVLFIVFDNLGDLVTGLTWLQIL